MDFFETQERYRRREMRGWLVLFVRIGAACSRCDDAQDGDGAVAILTVSFTIIVIVLTVLLCVFTQSSKKSKQSKEKDEEDAAADSKSTEIAKDLAEDFLRLYPCLVHSQPHL